MKHTWMVDFEPTETHPNRAIKKLLSRYPSVPITFSSDLAFMTKSDNEAGARALYEEAKRLGFKCSFSVATDYSHADALSGELGTLGLGASSSTFKAALPKDAFDFCTGCPRCGMGAAQVKPQVLSERSVRCKGNFYTGDQGAGRILMRAEIGREIVETTGQPWCMRRPVTKTGKIIEEWAEPVPCATMPPLSRKSQGVVFGRTDSGSVMGEPPEIVPPCPVCGRMIWDYDRLFAPRLVYPRPAIEAAQQHAVSIMYEPWCAFPGFDPARRTFRDLYGLPWLLFNRSAIKVLLKYMQTEHSRDSAWIQPVFSE